MRRRWGRFTRSSSRSRRHRWYVSHIPCHIIPSLENKDKILTCICQNRLLQMIRTQQLQLQQMQLQQQQQQQQQSSSSGTAVVDDSTPTSERSVSFPSIPPLPTPGTTTRSSTLSARRGSRSSQAASTSPSLRPVAVASEQQQQVRNDSESGEALARRSSRDESAYYQAETAMLTRENQMLRQRIRELGKYHYIGNPPVELDRTSSWAILYIYIHICT